MLQILLQEGALALLFPIMLLLFTLIPIAGMWLVYDKAGEPGWAAIIPIYNTYVMLKITNNPVWYLILFLIPLVNFLVSLKVLYDLAQAFGKGIGYMLGLILLPFVFFPLLGFGDAQFQGRGATRA